MTNFYGLEPATGYDRDSDRERQADEDAATRSWDEGCQRAGKLLTEFLALLDEHGMSKVLRMLAHAKDKQMDAFYQRTAGIRRGPAGAE